MPNYRVLLIVTPVEIIIEADSAEDILEHVRMVENNNSLYELDLHDHLGVVGTTTEEATWVLHPEESFLKLKPKHEPNQDW